MDHQKEGLLLIATTSLILISFLITVLAVMIIYRKRKLDHSKEINSLREKYVNELLQAQLEMQQQTMQYIGREIHDNVGQKLVLAALYSQQLNNGESVTSIINESLSDLRSLSRDLTESDYLKADICWLIHQECQKVQDSGSFNMRFSSNVPQFDMSQAAKRLLLRIIQEFLQNSLKHAGCTKMEVTLSKEDEVLEITAWDNGKGFQVRGGEGAGDAGRTGDASAGVGLNNMKKRTEMLSGTFLLESTPGEGTRMRITIPLDKIYP